MRSAGTGGGRCKVLAQACRPTGRSHTVLLRQPAAHRQQPRLSGRRRTVRVSSSIFYDDPQPSGGHPQTGNGAGSAPSSNGTGNTPSVDPESLDLLHSRDATDNAYTLQLPPKGVGWTAAPIATESFADDYTVACEQQNYASNQQKTLHRNQVQLSTYGNHIGNNLKDLHRFIQENLQGAVGAVHLLPIYPSTGDGGFAPTTYHEVDPQFGSWEDVEALGKEYDLCLEFMVNHISPASVEFQDFLEKGEASQYADMFVDWDKFWEPQGGPTQHDLKMIRTRKPEAPFLTVTLKDGRTKRLWCTFGAQQIDINPFSSPGAKFVADSLAYLCDRGVAMVRLDAFGYCTKQRGTRCFFQEPEVWSLLERVERVAHKHNTGLLCEVHEEYETNIKLAQAGYWVYDFSLPLLVLHAFTFRTAANLRHWLSVCPRRQITVLDTHDGMGIDDITGLAGVCDVEELKQVITDRLGCNPNYKYFYNEQTSVYTGSPHQYNCTYYSALRGNPRRYLLARAIQFFTPGIPMVYYVGMLAGRNDFEAMEQQGAGRAINRHRYSVAEAEMAVQQPVVQALLDLCRFRNTHPAFNGQVMVVDRPEEYMLEVTWKNGQRSATLVANLQEMSFEIFATKKRGSDGRLQVMRYELEGGVHTEQPESMDEESFEQECAVPEDALDNPGALEPAV